MENNKLIAEFMNEGFWQLWRKEGYKPYWSDEFNSKDEVKEALVRYCKKHDIELDGVEPKFIAPEYHKRWDLLMPVVDKIEQIEDSDGFKPYSVNIELLECEIINYKHLKSIEVYFECNSKIESVYQAVLEFIGYYNQQAI